jgi:hypothetical protein
MMATVTSSLVKETVAIGNPLRVPPIAADLMPVEVFQSRRNKRVARLVVLAVIGFTLLLGAWYGGELVRTAEQQADLDSARESVQDLTDRQKKYDDLVRIQNETAAIKAQLAVLMAGDIQWTNLIMSVLRAAPAGISLTDFAATVNSDSAAAAGSARELPSGAAGATVGTVTINGSGPSKEHVAQYVDALGAISGVANPFLTSAATVKGRVGFSITVDVTAAALDSRHVTRNNTGKVGN